MTASNAIVDTETASMLDRGTQVGLNCVRVKAAKPMPTKKRPNTNICGKTEKAVLGSPLCTAQVRYCSTNVLPNWSKREEKTTATWHVDAAVGSIKVARNSTNAHDKDDIRNKMRASLSPSRYIAEPNPLVLMTRAADAALKRMPLGYTVSKRGKGDHSSRMSTHKKKAAIKACAAPETAMMAAVVAEQR